MLTAKEANLKSQLTLNSIIEKELELIENRISSAVCEGKFYTVYSGELHKPTSDKLRNLGYKIEGTRRSDEFRISWDHVYKEKEDSND